MHKKGNKTSKCQQSAPCPNNLSSYSWLKSNQLAALHHHSTRGLPRDRRWRPGTPKMSGSLVSEDHDFTTPRGGGSTLKTVAGSIPDQQTDYCMTERQTDRQTGTQSFMSFLVVSLSLSLQFALSLATILRPYSRESAQPRSNTFPTCVCLMLSLRYLCTIPSLSARSPRSNQT